MNRFSILLFALLVFAVTFSATATSALAQGMAPAKQATKIGYLNCHVASGWGFIFGSSRKLQCVYTPAEKGKKIENYSGSITSSESAQHRPTVQLRHRSPAAPGAPLLGRTNR
jgi:hypothetical protein